VSVMIHWEAKTYSRVAERLAEKLGPNGLQMSRFDTSNAGSKANGGAGHNSPEISQANE
jgi:hypothetical protein